MSVRYLIACSADGCKRTANWSSPTLEGYRRALTREGWRSVGRRAPNGSDYCPDHAHFVEDESGTEVGDG